MLLTEWLDKLLRAWYVRKHRRPEATITLARREVEPAPHGTQAFVVQHGNGSPPVKQEPCAVCGYESCLNWWECERWRESLRLKQD